MSWGFTYACQKKSDIVQAGWRHSSSNVSMTSVPIFRISFTSAEKEGIGSQNTQEFKRILKKLGESKINFDSTVVVIKKKVNAYEYC